MRLLIKRKVFIASCVLIISLFCTSCSGLGDWEITGLPGGYEIWRINSRSVILCKPDPQYDFLAATVVPAYVFEIAYTDAYIFAKRADVPEDLDEPISYSDPDYYIVDTVKVLALARTMRKCFMRRCHHSISVIHRIGWTSKR